jgi:excisionase family DNA binding protein
MPRPGTTTALRLSQAARLLGVETRETARLVHERKIRYVMVDGIAHVPTDAVEEYRAAHSVDR